MKSEQIAEINHQDEKNPNFELSHIIGLKVNSPESVQCHPKMAETIIFAVGGIVICEDLTEKNNQVFFRHGQNRVSCFKISNSGRYLAVGFTIGEENFDKNLIASIIVWDYENKKILYEINEIYKAVTILEFSQDDKFLSAAGIDNSFFAWEVKRGFKCFNRVYESPITFIKWTAMTKSKDTLNNPQSEYNDYTITLGNDTLLFYCDFYFELRSMQYNIKFNKFVLPSTGYERFYTCGFYDPKFNCVYLGTRGGELLVFALDNLYFKNGFNVVNNGITSCVFLPETEEIIIGGGDGKVKKIQRKYDENTKDIMQVQHIVTCEITLPGSINSLSLTADRKEVVACSNTGKIFRILIPDLNYTLHSTSHSNIIYDVAFNDAGKVNDYCYSVDGDGNLFQYDLNDFNVLGVIPGIDEDNSTIYELPRACSVAVGDDQSIFVGYSNGNVRNYTSDFTQKLFEINTHKGPVNVIYVDGNYILTGGADGLVRVWTRRTHELVLQVPAHHSNVRDVFADVDRPNLIYSCGEDKQLNCYDLKLQKRINNQEVKNGFISGITQRAGKDNEIISVGFNCNMCVWDFYKNEPIKEFDLGEKMMTIKMSHTDKFCAIGSFVGELLIFKVPEFELVGKSQGHSMAITKLKWSPDDKQIVSVAEDGSMCIWNVYI